MAKYTAVLHGDLGVIMMKAENAIKQSISASDEEMSSFSANGVRCVVRAYERYSYIGSNRVSLCITYVQTGEDIYVTAIATGGSQAMLFKINTFGEESFLKKVADVFDQFKIRNF